MLDLDDLSRYRVRPDPRGESAVARTFLGMGEALPRTTDDLLVRLDARLAPACQHRADHVHDGTVGSRRFG